MFSDLVDRFSGNSEMSNASNVNDYVVAINLITNNVFNFIFGYGTSYNKIYHVITDGFLFALFLELGLIGFVFFIIFYTYIIYIYSKSTNNTGHILLFLLFVSLFYLIGLVNSAYMSKQISFIFWFYVAFSIKINYLKEKL